MSSYELLAKIAPPLIILCGWASGAVIRKGAVDDMQARAGAAGYDRAAGVFPNPTACRSFTID